MSRLGLGGGWGGALHRPELRAQGAGAAKARPGRRLGRGSASTRAEGTGVWSRRRGEAPQSRRGRPTCARRPHTPQPGKASHFSPRAAVPAGWPGPHRRTGKERQPGCPARGTRALGPAVYAALGAAHSHILGGQELGPGCCEQHFGPAAPAGPLLWAQRPWEAGSPVSPLRRTLGVEWAQPGHTGVPGRSWPGAAAAGGAVSAWGHTAPS